MNHLWCGALLASATLFSCQAPHSPQEIAIIPEPLSVKSKQGTFKLNSQTVIEYDHSNSKVAEVVKNLPVSKEEGNKNLITLSIDTSIEGAEAYCMQVTPEEITITAATSAGLFYGVQTLNQFEQEIPAMTIQDAPAFAWRGVMLDVSRHFQPKSYILEFIDMLAYHKINKFHWHLTDGIGWRIQIDRYPELTSRGAFRKIKQARAPWVGFEPVDQPVNAQHLPFTNDVLQNIDTPHPDVVYGGYYTKEDIREIVAYAASKYIEVIPEIEMPGHSEAVTFVYPEYICQGAKPGSGIYCAGKEQTYTFLQHILDEVAELFPSQYLHIGGDEVGKDQWAACPTCQKLKKKEQLKDEHELQSYFVKRMEKYINGKGKRLIGWDEITEGGLAESATVMSWTGWENGIKAANMHKDVIMVPLDYVYFDHYQGYNAHEPQAWGGYNPLKRFYEFPVIPEGIAPENVKYVKGGQANMWTENVRDTAHLEYMLFPRMAALSESLWSDSKNWNQFAEKMDRQFDRYAAKGWNYSESAMTPMIASQRTADQSIEIELQSELDYPIHYTLDNSEPTTASPLYQGVIRVTEPGTLKARSFRKGKPVGYPLEVNNLMNKAVDASIRYATSYNAGYSGGGDSALVDNRYAIHRGDDKAWQGFEKEDMVLTLEWPEAIEASQVDIRFFQHEAITSVMLPLSVAIEVSTDGKTFVPVFDEPIPAENNADGVIRTYTFTFPKQELKEMRITAKNRGTLPKGHRLAGGNAWVFTDEIAVH